MKGQERYETEGGKPPDMNPSRCGSPRHPVLRSRTLGCRPIPTDLSGYLEGPRAGDLH